MRSGSCLPLLTIAILVFLSLQQRSNPLISPALALRDLNDSSQIQNGSLPINSSASAYLPDPSNCDPPATTHMGTFFSSNSSKEQLNHGAKAVEPPSLASNFSKAQNSTHIFSSILNGNVSDCANTSSSAEQNQVIRGMKSYMMNHADEGAVAPVDENADLYESASVHVVAKGKDDVLLVEAEEDTASNLSAGVKESVQVMVINDDDVVLVDAEQVKIATAARSVAKDSVQVLQVDNDDVVFVDAERLGGPTPPPGSPSIHTAAGSSLAREAVHVMDLDTARDVFWINEPERLAGSTPPPSDTTIHTAAQSSVARESVQVMEIAEDDVGVVSLEQLGRATPPPVDTSIHTAGQRSAARESTQVVWEISKDGVNEEQLGASTPPPSDSDIHTASQSSVARDSSLHVGLQHDENRHFHTLRR